ncbi:MAG: DUF4175 family protein, partial [Geminicoccaceae bacterium]|nr:DUF4175 family protein [Geminicoccaceae bacterium]
MSGDSAGRRLERRLSAARWFEFVERLWPMVFPALVVVLVFVVLAWVDVWAAVPVMVHWAGLGLFALAFLAALHVGLRNFRLVTRREAVSRLERDSGLRHEPIAALGDELGGNGDDPLTARLWQRHRERALKETERLRVAPPRSRMPVLDPWALRAALGLVLIVAMVEARGAWIPRLQQALAPGERVRILPAELVADLWITPPAYTGLAPFSADPRGSTGSLDVPVGSEALLQLHGLAGREDALPAIAFAGTPLEPEWLGVGRDGHGSAQIAFGLAEDGELAVAAGMGEDAVLRSWTIAVIPDAEPEIAFDGEPAASQRGTLEIRFRAADDYGLQRLTLEFAAVEPAGAFEERELLAPAGSPKELATGVHVDLSAHPLAGLPVRMRLKASDAPGQTGVSEDIGIILPERHFSHPLARAIISVRKDIVRYPDERLSLSARLDALGRSEPAEQQGTGVQLSLFAIASRLRGAPDDPGKVRSVIDTLWDLALFIEEGQLSMAEKELRALQEALQRALLEGADDSELERLMDELQQAMQRYMAEMMRNALEQGQRMPEGAEMQPLDPSRMVTPEDLQSMLDRARELMRSGARDQAQELLAELQRMMENMQTAMQPMQPGPGEQAMGDLQRMIELQRDLLDRSFRMQNDADGMSQQGEQQGQQGQ